jgi:uncharacterized protein (TIGR02284 family)
MDTNSERTIKALHELIQVNQEGERGYKEASEKIDNREFSTILYRLSQQRTLFRGELEEILRKDFRDAAEVSDSLTSKVHRTWMDFTAGLSKDDDKAVFNECERGEEHAIKKYTEALDGRLPNYIEKIVKQQLELIRGTLSQIREFKYEENHA